MKHSLKTFCSQKADIYKSHSKKSKVFLKFLLTVMLLVTSILSYAQTGIGTTEPKGALDVVSSTGGFIMPRMNTATRTSITAGEEQKGMQIYDTDTKSVWLFNGTAWVDTLTSLALRTNDGPDGTAGTDDDFDELVYTDEDGTETKISVSSIETLTSLALQTNDNGTAADTSDDFDELVYKDEDGTETKISLTDEGKFVDGTDVTEAVYPGNVGIGTTNPIQKLDVRGNTYVSGNVGLGKTTAAQKLDVVGNAVVSGSIGVGITIPRGALDVVSTTSGFMMPRVTTTQRTAITAGTLQTGMQVYDTTTKSVWTFDGTNWVEANGGHIIGDIKQGLHTDDHNGWVKLDGRATSSLTSSQGLAAASIGISGSSIPDARNKVLMSRVGGSVNSTGGNNNVTIAKSNLPNYNMSGQTANGGFHSHYLSNGAAVTHRWGGTQWLSGSSTEYSGSASTSDMAVQGGGTHNHSLTVSTGGGGQALDITPSYLQVNTFIYLGN